MTDQPLEPDGPSAAPPEPGADERTETRPSDRRRLYRSRDDRVIAGVCGGLGAYFDVDSTLVRIAFVLLVFAGGAGILAYVLAWIFIPEAQLGAPAEDRRPTSERTGGALVVGLAFIVLGAFFLADEIWPDFLAWKYVWPIALIAVGAAILLRPRR